MMDPEVKEFAAVSNTFEGIEKGNILQIKNLMQKLYLIWNELGIDNTQKEERVNVVWKHVLNLLKDIIDEEKGYYEDVQERIKNYIGKIEQLSQVLNIPAAVEVNECLIKKEEILRHELDNLSKEKRRRLKVYSDLRSNELKLCKILSMPTHNLSSNAEVPSEKDLDELTQHINMLKEERDRRLKKFFVVKRELTTILEGTELSAETSVEKEILSSKEDSLFTLSNETFKALEEFVSKVQNKKAELETDKKVLMEKLNVLWERLRISEKEREMFLLRHTDCRVSTINSIKQEIQRCEEIKKQNIKSYLNTLRDEISSLWNKCFVSESERKLFQEFYAEDFSESILEAHDVEVEKLRKYYESSKHIVQKINKRQELWDLLLVFEAKARDPNRFKNRGGNLLQEEKERKKLQKELPALENEIFLDMENFELKNGKPFLYNGEDFREFVTNQWHQRLNDKENEKIMRHKLRSAKNDLTLTTPSKRIASVTPKSAPSKLFKSNVGLAVYRTPNTTSRKIAPSTAGKFKLRTKPFEPENFVKPPEINSVLKSNNKNILRKKGIDKSASPSLSTTTYTDFAEKLNRSSRYAHRSSVLSSKKIVGTRISNSSKRKSNKSIRKSASKKKADVSSKLTPARGKLGLPFLI